MLTFAEFQETRQRLSSREASEAIQVEEDHWSGDAAAVLIYDGSLYIEEMKDGSFQTFIERDAFSGSRDEMERTLFLEWYCSECADTYTTEQLSGLLTVWCAHYEVEPASADEILIDLYEPSPQDRTPTQLRQAVWIEWFIRTWEATQEAEDTAAPGAQI